MKKSISLFLAAILVLLSFSAVFAESSMSNFSQSRQYDGRFTDVKTSDWFYPYVTAAYEYGFVSGNSATTFNPNGNVTIAETLVIACQINSIYQQKEVDRSVTSPWYQPYVNYAVENGIIGSSDYANYTVAATRIQFATIMAKALPEEEYPVLSTTAAIPDIPKNASYATPIYKLYDAGIISGSDEKGTFHPNDNIKRSEVAVIALNLADSNRRKPNSFGGNDSTQNKWEMLDISINSPYDPITKTYNDFGFNEKTGAFVATVGEQVEFVVVDNNNIVENVEWKCNNKNIQIEPLASDEKGAYHCYVIGLGACDVEITTVIKYKDGGSDILGDLLSFEGLELNKDDIVIRHPSMGYLKNTESGDFYIPVYFQNVSALPIQLPTSIMADNKKLSCRATEDLLLESKGVYSMAPQKNVQYYLPAGERYSGTTFEVETISLVITWGGEEYYIECDRKGITYFKKGNKR